MLSRNMYTSEYINDLYKKTGNDPTLLERVVYAFGLLEAIKRVGLPFCFKGCQTGASGACLATTGAECREPLSCYCLTI